MKDDYLNSLTGLRGLAALAVTISHLPAFSKISISSAGTIGSFSVAIFFTLSGFLMGYIYAGKRFNNKSVGDYIISRISRIAPAYLTIVIVSFILFSFIDSTFPIQIDVDNLLRHLLFSGNQNILWSIPPEIQFYGLFIIFWFAMNSVFVNKKFTCIIMFAILCLLMMAFAHKTPGTFVGSNIEFFALGVIAGLLRKKTTSKRLQNNAISIQLIIIIAFSYFIIDIVDHNQTVAEFWNHQYYAVIASVLIYFISFQTTLTQILFNNNAMQKLGVWSFSLYLTHIITMHYFSKIIMIDTFLESILIVAVSIAASFFFHKLIELPGINILKRTLQFLRGRFQKDITLSVNP
jgi:peptidoglycan/LPS O-acetylase OafA/YrhL